MRIIQVLLVSCFFLFSCNNESISINGKLSEFKDCSLQFKLKSLSGKEKQIAETVTKDNGDFKVNLENVKPPCKLTVQLGNDSEYSFWVFRYGKFNVEVDANKLNTIKVYDSFENNEFQRMNKSLYEMYIDPIKEKELEVPRLEEQAKLEGLSDNDDVYLSQIKKDIKMAYRLRKKSILKTVRKHAQNPVAVALMCQEYNRLTSHQKKECLKYLNRTFSDTGLNWQMKK